ncbi:MAG: cation diffusion facilitator family transporter [Euryarchaeota archaeon]|nr:cation diffusion facilitator family transporter [Euryarchaeota archaeon]
MAAAKLPVIAAFVANLLVAIAKYFAAFFSGSSSMLAEAYHSTSDTLNQVALYRGIHVSERKASKRHEFGYGKAAYFWSFVVAILIFGVAGAFSLVEGFHKMRDPHALDPAMAWWVYGVLVFAFLFESGALFISIRELRKHQEDTGIATFSETLRRTKNAPLVTVFTEDGLALVGIVIAAVGVSATYATGNGVWDGAASFVIGLFLMVIALLLARRSRDLILGESMDPDHRLRVVEIVEGHPKVRSLVSLSSMYLGSEDLLVALDVDFEKGMSTDELERAVDDIEDAVREAVPGVRRIYVEAESGDRHVVETTSA